jgi:nucleoid DNA-binding protein
MAKSKRITNDYLTRKDFAAKMAERFPIKPTEAEAIVDMFLDTLKLVVAEGNGIKFLGEMTLDIMHMDAKVYDTPVAHAEKAPRNKVVMRMGKYVQQSANK